MIHGIARGILAAAAVAALGMAPAAAKDVRAVTSLQQTNTLTKSFLQTMVGPHNAAAGKMLKIVYIGGQEIVPPRKAANALKRGQFDMLHSPTAYYIGTVPEGYAILAANQGPTALRKNGAWKILEEIYMKKAGAHLLAWGESMTSYHMYLAKKPPMKDGIPNLTGMKMRATGTYRPLFRALGASTINIKGSEVFTAMQRGTVDGFGFTDVSVVPNGFHKVTKFRVMPNFYQTNTVVTVNAAVWKGLSGDEKAALNKSAIEYETTSVHLVEKWRHEEETALKEAGVQDIVLKGDAAARYLDIAHQEIWKELKKRSEYHDALKPLMYVPGKPNRQVDLKSATKRLRQ